MMRQLKMLPTEKRRIDCMCVVRAIHTMPLLDEPAQISRIWEKKRMQGEALAKIEPLAREISERNGGVFPGEKMLGKMGYGCLISPISRNGGFVAFRERIGAKAPPSNVHPTSAPLKDAARVEEELGRIAEADNGIFPTWTRLKELKRYDLVRAMTKYHGGYFNFKKKIRKKVEVRTGADALAMGRNFDKRLADVLRVNGGKIPTRDTMLRQGFGDFLSAMYRRKTTISKLRADAGQESGMRKGKESLASRKMRVEAARRMMEAERIVVLPGEGWPGWKGKYSRLHAAIHRHGGLNRFKEEIGPLGLDKTWLRIYCDWEKMKSALVVIIGRKGHLPTLEWFADNPMRRLELESIYTYHGNLWKVRMKMEALGLTPQVYPLPGRKTHVCKRNKGMVIL